MDQPKATDFLLLKLRGIAEPPHDLCAELATWGRAVGAAALHRVAFSREQSLVHAYARLPARRLLSASELEQALSALRAGGTGVGGAGVGGAGAGGAGAGGPGAGGAGAGGAGAGGLREVSATLSRLELVLDLAGHSHDALSRHHYVVETDADDGWMPEIARWYAEEHMPGLAGVPGCVRALRLVNHDDGPQSLACYDLTAPEVLGSPPWLAVRGTEWSSRTRPHFVNTLRTMFETLG